jgi:hypothetical protein
MGQVLAIVPTAGLDAVLVAVELALEGGPPSGRVSVEHVVNMLGRQNVAPLAYTAPCDSQRAEADTARPEADHA